MNWLDKRIPLLVQEGWTRPQEDVAKPPLIEADGVVARKQLYM